MKNTLETRLGIFFALALIAAFLIMEMLGSFDFFKRGIRIHAKFNTVQELKEGDPVKMAGVQIGRVEKIDLQDGKVDVTMKLNKPENVKTDSKAVVKFAGLMGQNFVAISFGSPSAPKAEDNTDINAEEQPDLNALMVKLEGVATGVENLTKSLSGPRWPSDYRHVQQYEGHLGPDRRRQRHLWQIGPGREPLSGGAVGGHQYE